MTDAEVLKLKADVEALRGVAEALINSLRYVLAENEKAEAHRRQALRRFLSTTP
jgi:hypothetical protein